VNIFILNSKADSVQETRQEKKIFLVLGFHLYILEGKIIYTHLHLKKKNLVGSPFPLAILLGEPPNKYLKLFSILLFVYRDNPFMFYCYIIMCLWSISILPLHRPPNRCALWDRVEKYVTFLTILSLVLFQYINTILISSPL